MRETRYAVEALAEAYPRPGGALKSWGNRDGQKPRSASGPARSWLRRSTISITSGTFLKPTAPRYRPRDSPVAGRPRAPGSIPCVGRLPGHGWPTLRAVDAADFGRLNDPSKIVWRAAAWSLRRLGNRGPRRRGDQGWPCDDQPRPGRPSRGGNPGLCLPLSRHGYGRVDLADRLIAPHGRPRPLDPPSGTSVAPAMVLPDSGRRPPKRADR